MHGGVILFRGTGADAMRYVESDRSRADDYYLGDATGISYTVLDGSGEAISIRPLDMAEYAGWVDWVNPDTGERMGVPRLAGPDRLGSPRFAEMVINAPKSLSIAAALHPEVSEALDAAQQDALSEIQRWLGQHSVTRVGPRGRQEVVPVEHMQVVGITHRTSRAGDPHRHIHMQVGTRVWAAGKWRALDTGAMFKQQGAIRALGTAVIAASPHLASVLDRHGLTLDPVTGEVTELEPFNALMSKRGAQVRRNLERLEAEWEAVHPGETMGPVVSSRLTAQAWAHERPAKKPTTMREEAAWLTELREAGYDPDRLVRRPAHAPVASAELSVQKIASRALDRCAATASTWTRHDMQDHATRIITEHGLRATPAEVCELVGVATRLALEDCFSVLPDSVATPEHVAHLTSLRVVQAETKLRDLLTTRAPEGELDYPDVVSVAARLGQQLDAGQLRAAAAVASTDPLVIVEGAAGAGKTTMLATAITAVAERGGAVRVVAPTKRAAEVAREELGVPAASVASLVHAHGYRWNTDGAWTRLAVGDMDPETGAPYSGAPQMARLRRGERIVVDEAGMLDQDTALALLTVASEAGATIALVGDRAQLPAVGRGGVLDMAAQIRGRTFDMVEVHRFTDPAYADLTIRMRDRRNPGDVFDQLHALGLIRMHKDADTLYEHIAQHRQDGEAVTVASREDAARVNERIRDERVTRGLVDDQVTATGSDGLSIGAGDLIQTRRNDTALGVANRQQRIVQHVEPDGSIWVRDAHTKRKREHTKRLPAEYVQEHAHLSYAATAYGVQGVTAPATHTILTDTISGAAVYVGMTRGRDTNTLHVIANSAAEARQQFIDAMERDRADRGLVDATERAAEAVRGLVNDGPVRLVNQERAWLTSLLAVATQQVAHWSDVEGRLIAQRDAHRVSEEEQADLLVQADEAATEVHAAVFAPLHAQARRDGQALLAARDATRIARAASRDAGPFGKRAAARRLADADTTYRRTEETVLERWGRAPDTETEAWATTVARAATDADPRVIEAANAAGEVRAALTRLRGQQLAERAQLRDRLGTDPHGIGQPGGSLTARLSAWRQRVATAKAHLDELDSLPVDEAAALVRERRTAAEAQRAARVAEATARALRLSSSATRATASSMPEQDRPGRSL